MMTAASSTSSAQRLRTANTRLIFWLLFSLHLVLALTLKFVVGINIESHVQVGSWDWYWQAVPTANLLAHPFSSVWYFHAQPPLFNLLGALLMRLFYPNHIQALQYLYIFMGALSVGMSYVCVLAFSKSVKLSLLVALFWGLNPSLFLYEAYILYDVLTAFEIIMLVFLLALFSVSISARRNGYLVAFIVVLTLLLLTRSLYHLIFLAPCLIMVCVLAGKQWKQILMVGLCCALLPLGWYAKNYQQVGQFSASTWMGISLWKVAIASYSTEELEALAQQGVIDLVVVEVTAYSVPSKYVAYGFDKLSDNEELARDDFNNVNIPAISKLYQVNSLRLIRHDPLRYLQAVLAGFMYFCGTASRFYHLDINREKLGLYGVIYVEFLEGHYPFLLAGINAGSILVILFPFTLLLYTMRLLARCGISIERWARAIRLDGPMIFTAMLLAYTLAVSCTLEFSENMRFKFAVEAPMWAFIAATLYRRYRRPPLIPLLEPRSDGS